MMELETLSNKVFSLLKGNGLKIKIFDAEGAETTNPDQGRRFFVMDPNIMITIDEDSNSVEFSKGSRVTDEIETLQKNIKKISNEFLMNFGIKVFGKTIKPRDYAYQAKMKKDSVMENTENLRDIILQDLNPAEFKFPSIFNKAITSNDSNLFSEIRTELLKLEKEGLVELKYSASGIPSYRIKNQQDLSGSNIMYENVNSLLLGKVLKELDYVAAMSAEALTKNIIGSDLNQVQQALNKLVQEGKVTVSQHPRAGTVYSKRVEEAITESFSKMFGSLRTSLQMLENVKIIVKHKTPIDENVRGARSRHISAIFLECNGERFRFPHNYLAGARAMAQHLAHGGSVSDQVGSYISESTGNLLKLQSFNRYVTANKLINEDSSGIVETVKENIDTIRTELKKLTGVKTYETVRARIETFERQQLDEDDVSQLKDLFTIRRFDEKFEEVLPIVKQLIQEKDTYHKRIEESVSKSVIIKRESINNVPMFEFASENAKLGYKLSELALRIVENDELSDFVSKIGTKLCKEGTINDFEKAVISQLLENIQVEDKNKSIGSELKESVEIESFFDKYIYKFF